MQNNTEIQLSNQQSSTSNELKRLVVKKLFIIFLTVY